MCLHDFWKNLKCHYKINIYWTWTAEESSRLNAHTSIKSGRKNFYWFIIRRLFYYCTYSRAIMLQWKLCSATTCVHIQYETDNCSHQGSNQFSFTLKYINKNDIFNAHTGIYQNHCSWHLYQFSLYSLHFYLLTHFNCIIN